MTSPFHRKARLALVCLILLLVSACGSSTPTMTETSTETPAPLPTSTSAPTSTAEPSTPTSEPVTATGTPSAADPTLAAGAPVVNQTTVVPTQIVKPPSGGAVADKYQYLGQDVADHTQFLPNRTVTVTWTVKNIGTTGWTTGYSLRYFSGPKPSKEVYPFTKEVPVQATINFVVTFTTPDQPGDYDLWFKLTNQEGQNFGDVDLVFTVSNNPQKIANPTPTPVK